ncbi:hypothetical protein B0H10DRAFT_1938896 [Mycena sp. CBHHK59/15]|nr:hypothetical protein B0H10DRAFT_1938896 [Mycena sp. CBHHK59/15]
MYSLNWAEGEIHPFNTPNFLGFVDNAPAPIRTKANIGADPRAGAAATLSSGSKRRQWEPSMLFIGHGGAQVGSNFRQAVEARLLWQANASLRQWASCAMACFWWLMRRREREREEIVNSSSESEDGEVACSATKQGRRVMGTHRHHPASPQNHSAFDTAEPKKNSLFSPYSSPQLHIQAHSHLQLTAPSRIVALADSEAVECPLGCLQCREPMYSLDWMLFARASPIDEAEDTMNDDPPPLCPDDGGFGPFETMQKLGEICHICHELVQSCYPTRQTNSEGIECA